MGHGGSLLAKAIVFSAALWVQVGPADANPSTVDYQCRPSLRGGGLLSGTALAVKGRSSGTRVLGAEPANADDARRSLETGTIQPSNDPTTIADGLRTVVTSAGCVRYCHLGPHDDPVAHPAGYHCLTDPLPRMGSIGARVSEMS